MKANGKSEQISALIDDTLSPEEKRKVLELIKQDKALQEKWKIYHLIQHVLKSESAKRKLKTHPLFESLKSTPCTDIALTKDCTGSKSKDHG